MRDETIDAVHDGKPVIEDGNVRLGRGRELDRLPATMLRLGAARLIAGDPDDLAPLVPEYVTLPRGVRAEASVGEEAWSRTRP